MTAPHDASDPTAVAILNAALMHVPFDGWSDAALAAGAADAGVEQHLVSALFQRGAIDAIALHSRLADTEMVAAFHGFLKRRPAFLSRASTSVQGFHGVA